MKAGLSKSISLTGQLLLVLSLVSCATTTTIQAVDSSGRVDEGVKIYLDGVHKGNGQIRHRYTFETAFTPTAVELQKEGCGTVKNSTFLNRLWPYFAGAAVLVFGTISLYYHLTEEQPYDFKVAESNGLTHALLLSMTASFIGLAGLKDPVHSYHVQCKVSAAVSASDTANQTAAKTPTPTNTPEANEAQTSASQQKQPEVVPVTATKSDEISN